MNVFKKKIYEMTFMEGLLASLLTSAILSGICQGCYYVIKAVRNVSSERNNVDNAYDNMTDED